MMTCEKFSQMLDNYENLTDEEKALMSEHAAKCEECERNLRFMRSVINSVQTLPEMNVPDDFLSKLNERIDAQERPLKKSFASHMRYNWQKYSAAAACLVIATVIGANYDTLVNRMNGADDGIIREVTTGATSPLPGVPTAAPKPESTFKAEPLDDGTVIGDAAGRINGANNRKKTDEKTEGIDTALGNPVMSGNGFSSHAQSRGGFNSGAASSSSLGSSRTQRGIGSTDVPSISASGYTSPQIAASAEPESEMDYEENKTNQEPQTNQEVQAASNSGQETADDVAPRSTSDIQTMTLPRGIYVEARGGNPAEDSLEPESEDAENGASSYSIGSASKTEGYATANTGSENDNDYRDRGDDNESDSDDGGLGYELNQSNMIVVRGEDFATAFDIICQYVSDSYGNYFMVTADNIDAMLSALDEAGVYYHDNIAVDTDKITFRISVG